MLDGLRPLKVPELPMEFQLSGTFKGRSPSSLPSVIQIPFVILLVLYLIFFKKILK
jgi:hypothetical protein